MRITNNIISRSQFQGIAASMAALDKAQAHVTTGKRMLAASDDPTGAMQSMTSDTSLRALDQYRTNVQRAFSRIGIEDDVLNQVGNLLTRAKELGVSQAGSTASSQTRGIANAEVQQLFKEMVQLGNTKFGNEYMFGGNQSLTQPFTSTGAGATLDYTSSNPQGTRTVEINDGQTMAVALDGQQLMLDSGVLDAVKALSRALDPASTTYGSAGIADAMQMLDAAYESVQTLVGDVGAKGKTLDSTKANLDAYKTNLKTFKSDLEDIDIEQAVTELTNRQVAYQAAMLATSKVMGLTLADYLR
jgi:flagellar hook-associated protein 3 FlgL